MCKQYRKKTYEYHNTIGHEKVAIFIEKSKHSTILGQGGESHRSERVSSLKSATSIVLLVEHVSVDNLVTVTMRCVYLGRGVFPFIGLYVQIVRNLCLVLVWDPLEQNAFQKLGAPLPYSTLVRRPYMFRSGC